MSCKSTAPLKRSPPQYPAQALMSGREGWVELSFIVSKDGKVGDVMVEDSSSPAFEHAAASALRTWRYTPAKRNGQPVEQSMTRTKILFELANDQNEGATRAFANRFKVIQKMISAHELDKAKPLVEALDHAEKINFYEDAWYWWLKYEYLDALGTAKPEELADCLQKALGWEQDYLPADVLVEAAKRLFVLQVRSLDYSGALRTFKRLDGSKRAKDSKYYGPVTNALKPIDAKIVQLVNGNQVIASKGRVGEHSYWVHDLLRRSFSFDKVQGSVEAVSIRCKKGTATYDSWAKGSVWNIPESWGACGVYIKGTEGTTFAFYEYPGK